MALRLTNGKDLSTVGDTLKRSMLLYVSHGAAMSADVVGIVASFGWNADFAKHYDVFYLLVLHFESVFSNVE